MRLIPKRRRRAAAAEPERRDSKPETIAELCSFEHRLAGSDAERRAANAMVRRLRSIGRRTEVEAIYVHPQAPLIWAAHCLIAFAGSLAAVQAPVAGFAAVLFASTSLYLDLNGRFHILRRLFFRRASQNVVSPGRNPGASARLILAAHLDTARTGAVFQPKQVARATRLAGFLPFPHTRLLFWSVAILLPMLGARMAGVESDLVSAAQLLPTLFLLIFMFMLVEWQLSKPVPGANDNASGVAVALAVAEDLEAEPTADLDVWVVLTGGEECGMEGMRSFLRSRRKELDPAQTIIVAIDSVGAGDVRWVVSEGLTVSFEMDRRLTQLCEAVAEADVDGPHRYRATPLRHGFATDALAARVRGLRATAITCLQPGAIVPAKYHTPADTPEAVDRAALDRAHGFALDLVRVLDRDAARARRRRESAEASPPQ